MTPKPAIVIFEPSETLREALATLMRRAEMDIFAVVTDLDELLSVACRAARDVMFLIGEPEPGVAYLDKVARLRAAFPDARIVLLVASGRRIDLARAATFDVDGMLSKSLPGRVILQSLEIIRQGGRAIMFDAAAETADDRDEDDDMAWNPRSPNGPGFAEEAPRERLGRAGAVESRNLGAKLTLREMDVLKCLGQGMPNKVIARQFEIGEATVKVHIKSILRKINVVNRTQAAVWAMHQQQSARYGTVTGTVVRPSPTVVARGRIACTLQPGTEISRRP